MPGFGWRISLKDFTVRATKAFLGRQLRLAVRDKTFLIAEPMGKVSWTKCFAAGGGTPRYIGQGFQKARRLP